MSHTTRKANTTFIHNGDFSGNIIIINREAEKEIEVRFADLFEIVADYKRQHMVGELEDATAADVLGITTPDKNTLEILQEIAAIDKEHRILKNKIQDSPPLQKGGLPDRARERRQMDDKCRFLAGQKKALLWVLGEGPAHL